MDTQTATQQQRRFLEDRSFLEQRGIRPGAEGYSTRQLAFQLSRRGWRWQFEPGHAEATKVLTPSGTEQHTITADDLDTTANPARVLAEAIRFDEARGLTPPRPVRADVVLCAPDGEIIAVVEAKNRKGWTPDRATAWRRNLLMHGLQDQEAPYFLLTSQEIGYLWDQREGLDPDAPPAVSFSMAPVLQRYAPWLAPNERLGEPQLEVIVETWLNSLARADETQAGSIEETLEQTGFLSRIRHARVCSEIPA